MSALRFNPPGHPVEFRDLGPAEPYVNPFRFSGTFVRPIHEASPLSDRRREQMAAASRRYQQRQRERQRGAA